MASEDNQQKLTPLRETSSPALPLTMGPLEATSLYFRDVMMRIDSLKLRHEVLKLGEVTHSHKTYPLYAIKSGSRMPDAPNVIICAGIHGDEKAGVQAALDFMEQHHSPYSGRLNFTVIPCMNPSGFEATTRASASGTDINRDFGESSRTQEATLVRRFIEGESAKFVLGCTLHEDNSELSAGGRPLTDNPDGFYLYEYRSNASGSLGRGILADLEGKGVSVYKKPMIYSEKNDHGMVLEVGPMDPKRPDSASFENFLRRCAACVINTETPTSWSWDSRVKAQILGIKSALDRQ
ncbi:MAG: M14 family metallocarboxypeptidase [Candidatus Altiarchaeota archaeon]